MRHGLARVLGLCCVASLAAGCGGGAHTQKSSTNTTRTTATTATTATTLDRNGAPTTTTPVVACSADKAPAALTSGEARPTKIVSDGTSVYWVTRAEGNESRQTVSKMSVTGGSPVRLATGLHAPDYLAVDAMGVYWVDAARTFPNNPQILTVPLAGGTPKVLVADGVSGHGFTVAHGTVYWFDGATLHGIATTGGAITTAHPSSENVFNATADDANLYWIDDHQHVLKLPFGATTASVLTTLAPPSDFLGLSQPITVDGTGVYAPANPGGGKDAILKIPLAGGTPTTVATFDGAYNGVPGIVSDGTDVYWANNFNAAVMRAPVTGGPAATVSCGPAKPNGIAMDAHNVYWTTDAGDIEKLAK
jgi:hypothetical protein